MCCILLSKYPEKETQKIKAAALRLLTPKETEHLKDCPSYKQLLALNPKPISQKRKSSQDLANAESIFNQLKNGQNVNSRALAQGRSWWSWVKAIAMITITVVIIVVAITTG